MFFMDQQYLHGFSGKLDDEFRGDDSGEERGAGAGAISLRQTPDVF